MIPGAKGDFIVRSGEVVLWDKRRRDDNAFPSHPQILEQIQE